MRFKFSPVVKPNFHDMSLLLVTFLEKKRKEKRIASLNSRVAKSEEWRSEVTNELIHP